MENVTEVIYKDLFEDEAEETENDLLELLEFTRKYGVPLTDEQTKAFFLLNEFGLGDIAHYANAMRPHLTSTKQYFKLVDKITLADRIKGNAKLSNLLKANVPNPNNTIPASELQPKALRKSELR
jgi:hypothetical protein